MPSQKLIDARNNWFVVECGGITEIVEIMRSLPFSVRKPGSYTYLLHAESAAEVMDLAKVHAFEVTESAEELARKAGWEPVEMQDPAEDGVIDALRD